MSNSGKRIALVTGGAGFVGSHLAEALARRHEGTVLSLDDYSRGRERNHVEGVEYRRGNTRDIVALIPETPDIVFHLGEYARIAPSLAEPDVVFSQNIAGTIAVLEFCRRRGVKKLVYAASSTRFAIEDDGRFQTPYAFSKATNADLVAAYGRWYQLPYAITYFYNVYGPREEGDGSYATVVARFKQQYLRGEPLTVVKPGTQQRGFTHVDDTVDGLLRVGDHGLGDGYQFGAGRDISIRELASLFPAPMEMIDGDPGRHSSRLDASKAQALGWRPRIDVTDHVREFVAAHPTIGQGPPS